MTPDSSLKPVALAAFAAAVLLFTFVLATGCGSKPQDVTNDPGFGDFKSIVGAWKTKVPLRVVDINKRLYLLSGDQTQNYWRELAVVPVGTEVRIDRLVFQKAFETDYLDAIGSVRSGPYANKALKLDSSLFGRDLLFLYKTWHGGRTRSDSTNFNWNWTVAQDKLERPASQ